jgi:hypothetical protein
MTHRESQKRKRTEDFLFVDSRQDVLFYIERWDSIKFVLVHEMHMASPTMYQITIDIEGRNEPLIISRLTPEIKNAFCAQFIETARRFRDEEGDA